FPSLISQLKADFCVVSAFLRRRHGHAPQSERRQKGTVPAFPGLSMPSHVFDDPKHWRERAEQARALAGQMSDAASKEMMLEIAKDYERLAERAEQRSREERKKKES